MIDIVDRLSFDATRCEAQFSKGVAGNITEAAAEIQRLRKALQFIADGYDNQDVNHVDYRVKVYQVALDALTSTDSRTTANIEGGA